MSTMGVRMGAGIKLGCSTSQQKASLHRQVPTCMPVHSSCCRAGVTPEKRAGRQLPQASKGEVDISPDQLRSLASSQYQYSVRRAARKSTGNPVSDMVYKIQLAWKIFFPDAPKQELSPKEEVKRRLRMVLVADRCGMSPASLSEMKKTIVKALQDFVDIEGEDGIEVSITSEPGLGTVYSVNIPIRRVKAESRFDTVSFSDVGLAPDGVTLEWDPADYNSDPSSRFPMGC